MDDNEQLATIKKPGEIERVSNEEFERRVLNIAKSKRDIYPSLNRRMAE